MTSLGFEGRLNEVLSKRRVADVTSKRKVQAVLADRPAAEAFALLSENKVLSVPVLRSESAEHEPLGYVDYKVLSRHLVSSLLESKQQDGENNAAVGRLTAEDVAGVSFADITCGELLKRYGAGAVTPFFDGNPATYLPRLFTNHLHRTIVYSEVTKPDGVHRELKMTGICSQTDLLRYLHSTVAEDEKLSAALRAPVTKAGYETQGKTLGRVPATATVLQALHSMQFSGFRAVAIDAADGSFAGAFSLEALRGLGAADKAELVEPVLDFVKRRAPASLEPATVALDDTVEAVLGRFVTESLHEAWVVGESGAAEGVVTQTNVISMLTRRGEVADAADAERRAGEFAWKLPGTLFVKVASGSGLVGGTLFKTVRAGVRVKFGEEEVFATRAEPGRAPAWGNSHSLEISAAAAAENRPLVFEVFDESQGGEVIGFFKVSLKWILSAFGTGQGALRNFADAYRIRQDNQPGEIQVEFVWLG